MDDWQFREDENELPYLVSSKRDENSKGIRNPSKMFKSACRLMDKEEYDDAIDILDVLVEKYPNDVEYWNVRGIAYHYRRFHSTDFPEAIKSLDRALDMDADNRTILRNKYIALIDYAGNLYGRYFYGDAIEKIDEAFSLMEDTNDADLLSIAWNIKGLCYHALANEKALECYDEALKYAPRNKTIKNNKEAFLRHEGFDNLYFYPD